MAQLIRVCNLFPQTMFDLYTHSSLGRKYADRRNDEALHDVVKSGKVSLYYASAMFAYQFQQANHVLKKWLDKVRINAESSEFDLSGRRAEMIPYCRSENRALTPYSPMAFWTVSSYRAQGRSAAQQIPHKRQNYDETTAKRIRWSPSCRWIQIEKYETNWPISHLAGAAKIPSQHQ